MEMGFEHEQLDRFMKRYIKNWVETNLGFIESWRHEMSHQPIFSFGEDHVVQGRPTSTVTFRGTVNPGSTEIKLLYEDHEPTELPLQPAPGSAQEEQ